MKHSRLKSITMLFLIVLLVQASVITSFPTHFKVYGQDSKVESVPDLLITEIVAQSTTEGGSDAYEFVEIYNNTNQAINLQDYLLRYHYPEPADDLIWPIDEELIIESEGTFVFWLGKEQNQALTVDDFNENFDSNLVEKENIYKIDASALHNERHRAVVIETKSGHEIAHAAYNDGSYDVVANKGIFYKYPEDGSNKMVLIGSASEPATPGEVDSEQIPDQPNQVDPDAEPQVNDLTESVQSQLNERVIIDLQSENNKLIKMLALYYKVDDGDYKNVPFQYNVETESYQYTIDDLSEILGSSEITYYYVASNGPHIVTGDEKTIDTTVDSNIKLNVEDGDTVSGKFLITGTAEGGSHEDLKLKVNETEVNAHPTLGTTAHFKFWTRAMNKGYQNAVTFGEETLLLMDEAPTGTITVPITEGLVEGENEIAIRPGDYHQTYFEENDISYGKLNTFIVSDFQLLLSDGTLLRDPEYGDSVDEFRIGDAGTEVTPKLRKFSFNIPVEKLDALAYEWDTTEVDDGVYTIEVVNSAGQTITADVVVDNHGPEIETTLIDGEVYKGDFVIDVTVTDLQTDVASTKVLLDDKQIEVPYETSSSKLNSGEHTLTVIADDLAGNTTEKTINFSVVEEHPYDPKIIAPTDGAKDVAIDPSLEVEVTDPTDDNLDVTFYQGYAYNALDEGHVKIFTGETPTTNIDKRIPDGEREITADQYEQIATLDGQLLVNDSSQFPYIRVEATVDEDLMDHEDIQLYWEGQTLPGRKVVMKVWNYTNETWDTIIESETFVENNVQLTGEVQSEHYVKDHQITYMIQDQDQTEVNHVQPLSMARASEDTYDYAFAWLTDTQFNVESDPRIFKAQVDWIKDNVEDKKIKYVFHTGDIVNRTFEENQWKIADEYMGVFDENNIPYGVLAGNHDVGQGYILDFDYSYFEKYFGEDRFADKPYYGGSYKNNRGHYDLISENGNDYIMVHMGWGDGDPNENWLDEDIAWMNEVLAAYPNRIAILSFHKYIHTQGMREPANADQIYEEVVVPNENVVMVLGGHYTQSRMVVDEIDDNGDGNPDRKVYQILSNYQGTDEGGAGYLKLIQFDVANHKVNLKTYSPYLDDFDPDNKLPGDGEFELEIDLAPNDKRVATDYTEIGLFTDQEIGVVNEVVSGEQATVTWDGLDHDRSYHWYVTVTDDFGGFVKSPLQQFSTSTEDPGGGGEDPGDGGESPGDGGEDPGDNGESPGDGGEDPGDNGESLCDGGEDPGDDGESPGDGGEDPGDSGESPGNGGEDPGTGGESPGDGGNILPKTATSIYNTLFIGLMVLALGLVTFIWRRYRIINKKVGYSEK